MIPPHLNAKTRVLIAGGGGFIGGHLVAELRRRGVASVRSVDIKPVEEWWQVFSDVDNRQLDLREIDACREACKNIDLVFCLAADMGGMGFIESNKADCMLSVLISTHMLMAAREQSVERFFYSSTACVYNVAKQAETRDVSLRESDAYPAMPEDGYGWEKLFSERLCRHFLEDYGVETRVARYHNVYGPHGSWTGGREKAPAAICRKVAEAVLSGNHEIEIWGDGEQTRSFMHIDDCLHGSLLIALGDSAEPVNLGSDRMVTINELVDIVEKIAGVKLERRYKLDAPKGVRGRNSNNKQITVTYGWAPSIALEDGLESTYRWVFDQAKTRDT